MTTWIDVGKQQLTPSSWLKHPPTLSIYGDCSACGIAALGGYNCLETSPHCYAPYSTPKCAYQRWGYITSADTGWHMGGHSPILHGLHIMAHFVFSAHHPSMTTWDRKWRIYAAGLHEPNAITSVTLHKNKKKSYPAEYITLGPPHDTIISAQRQQQQDTYWEITFNASRGEQVIEFWCQAYKSGSRISIVRDAGLLTGLDCEHPLLRGVHSKVCKGPRCVANSITIYKPNNKKFQVQGAVSAGSRLERLKLDIIRESNSKCPKGRRCKKEGNEKYGKGPYFAGRPRFTGWMYNSRHPETTCTRRYRPLPFGIPQLTNKQRATRSNHMGNVNPKTSGVSGVFQRTGGNPRAPGCKCPLKLCPPGCKGTNCGHGQKSNNQNVGCC